jgi:hypothetical protein
MKWITLLLVAIVQLFGFSLYGQVPAATTLRPIDPTPGKFWVEVWKLMAEPTWFLFRVFVTPPFEGEYMVTLSPVQDGKLELEYAKFDQPMSYLLRRGEKPKAMKPERWRKRFPANIAAMIEAKWVAALMRTEYPKQFPGSPEDAVNYKFFAFRKDWGMLAGEACVPDMTKDYHLIKVTELLVQFVRASDANTESKLLARIEKSVESAADD